MSGFFSIDTLEKIVESILVILMAVGVYFVARMILDRHTKEMKRGKRLTYLKLLRSAIKYVLIILVSLTVLQICGVDTVSIVAGLGVVSVIMGLALQDALKDIITGFNIITDGFFAVGDVVRINEITGKVLEIGVKSVRLQNLLTGDIEVIANRNISNSTILSKQLDIDLPLPYGNSVDEIEKMFEEILEKVKKISGVIDARYCGIQEYGESAVIYRLRLFANVEQRFQVGRDVRCEIKRRLDETRIAIPYKQIDVHQIK